MRDTQKRPRINSVHSPNAGRVFLRSYIFLSGMPKTAGEVLQKKTTMGPQIMIAMILVGAAVITMLVLLFMRTKGLQARVDTLVASQLRPEQVKDIVTATGNRGVGAQEVNALRSDVENFKLAIEHAVGTCNNNLMVLRRHIYETSAPPDHVETTHGTSSGQLGEESGLVADETASVEDPSVPPPPAHMIPPVDSPPSVAMPTLFVSPSQSQSNKMRRRVVVAATTE